MIYSTVSAVQLPKHKTGKENTLYNLFVDEFNDYFNKSSLPKIQAYCASTIVKNAVGFVHLADCWYKEDVKFLKEYGGWGGYDEFMNLSYQTYIHFRDIASIVVGSAQGVSLSRQEEIILDALAKVNNLLLSYKEHQIKVFKRNAGILDSDVKVALTEAIKKIKEEKELPKCQGSDSSKWTKYNGKTTFYDGNKYVGEWKDGKAHGYGEYMWVNGNFYVGQFENGEENGKGTAVFIHGDKYVGDWKDGKPHGRGTYTFASGNEHVGENKFGMPDGLGTYTFANGNKYVGQFKKGKYHGRGAYTYADGMIKRGIWKNHEIIEEQ